MVIGIVIFQTYYICVGATCVLWYFRLAHFAVIDTRIKTYMFKLSIIYSGSVTATPVPGTECAPVT